MKNKILNAILAIALIASLNACSTNPSDKTTDSGSLDTQAPIAENQIFKDGSIVMKDGIYTNIDGDENEIVLSDGKYSAQSTFEFSFKFDSRSARIRIYTDVRADENDAVTSAHYLQIDALNGRMALYELKNGESSLLGYAKYPFQKDVSYTVRLINGKSSISVHFGNETAPVINVNCTRLPSSLLGISFCGGTKAQISEPIISDTEALDGAKYKNPMLENEVIPDPTVLFYDGTYYMFGTGSFVCRTSTDLINWKNEGAVAQSKDLYGTKYFGGAAIYERDGKFYMLYTSHQSESSGLSVFYATADSPLGPYTQSGSMQEHVLLSKNSPAGSFLFRDPVSDKDILYFYRTDSIGNVLYATNVKIENGKITVTDKEPTKLTEPTESWETKKENGVSFPVCERPNVIYHNGYYYVFYAGSHYKTSYSEGYIVSKKPMSDFEKPKDTNPVLDATASLTGVGCTWIVPSPDGSELFVLYHCHDSVDSFKKRRLCMDRLTFRENPDGDYDIPVIHGPTVSYQPAPSNK